LAALPDGVVAVMLKEAFDQGHGIKKGGGYYRPGRNRAPCFERISSL